MPQQTFQRCFNVVFWLIRRRDVGKLQINVETMYFNVDINNVRQRRNHVVILNVDMNNAGKRQNNVVKMSIFKKKKKSFQIEYTKYEVLTTISESSLLYSP